MQRATASSACLVFSGIGGLLLAPLPNGLQTLSAAANAGPLNVIPSIVGVELPGENTTVMPPLGPGSGKFGTPWARMHRAAANSGLDLAEDAERGVEDDPHAASGTAHAATSSRASAAPLRLRRLGWKLTMFLAPWILVAWGCTRPLVTRGEQRLLAAPLPSGIVGERDHRRPSPILLLPP